MRRLAFLAAASLAFIAISEPPSASAATKFCKKQYDKCRAKCVKYMGEPSNHQGGLCYGSCGDKLRACPGDAYINKQGKCVAS